MAGAAVMAALTLRSATAEVCDKVLNDPNPARVERLMHASLAAHGQQAPA